MRVQKRNMNKNPNMPDKKRKMKENKENKNSNGNKRKMCEKDCDVNVLPSKKSKPSTSSASLEKGTVFPNEKEGKNTDCIRSTRSKTRAIGKGKPNMSEQLNGVEVEKNCEKNYSSEKKCNLCEKDCDLNVLSSKNAISSFTISGAPFKMESAVAVPDKEKDKSNSCFQLPIANTRSKTLAAGIEQNTNCISAITTRSKTRGAAKSNLNAVRNEIEVERKRNLCEKDCDSNVLSSKNAISRKPLQLKSTVEIIPSRKKEQNTNCIPATVTRSKTRAAGETNLNTISSFTISRASFKMESAVAVQDKEKNKSNAVRNEIEVEKNYGSTDLIGNKQQLRSKIGEANVLSSEKRNLYEKGNSISSPKVREIQKVASVRIDDLVWAKLSGWPYWPSTVEEIMPDGMIRVRFIEKKSRFAVLKITQIVPFEEGCFNNEIKKSVKKNQTLKQCVKNAMTKMFALELMNS